MNDSNGDDFFTSPPETPTTSNNADKRTSVYFRGDVLLQIKEEAARMDRTVSWVISRAWAIAKPEIEKLQAMSDATDDEADTSEA